MKIYNWLPGIGILMIIILSLIMQLRVFNLDLISMHVWRQTETQTVIQNFAREDMNILNPRFNNRADGDGIFRKEFPLMQWIIALSYKFFKESIMLTRIMMFIFSILTMFGFYKIGKIVFGRIFPFAKDTKLFLISGSDLMSLIPAYLIVFSPTFFFFSVNPIPDIFALMCLSWGIYFYFKWKIKSEKRFLILSLYFLMISSLVKLPFILFYSIYFVPLLNSFRLRQWRELIFFIVSFFISILPVMLWYLAAIPSWKGNGILQGITAVKGGEGWKEYLHYFQHNTISTLPELLIGYAVLPLFIVGVFFAFKNRIFRKQQAQALLLPFILFILYFLFELNMIGEAHDYYLFPFYLFIVLIISYGFREILSRNKKIASFALVLILLLPVSTFFRLKGRWNIEKPGFNKDLLTYKDELRKATANDSLCVAGNDISPFIMLYYIDKKGWTYSDQYLPPEQLKDMINRGARYLYSDNKEVYQNPDIQIYMEKQIAEFGSVKIFSLMKVAQ